MFLKFWLSQSLDHYVGTYALRCTLLEFDISIFYYLPDEMMFDIFHDMFSPLLHIGFLHILIQLMLSSWMTAALSELTPISSNRDLRQRAACTAAALAWYSVSLLEIAAVGCFFEFQLIAAPSFWILNAKPVINRLSSTSLVQLVSHAPNS